MELVKWAYELYGLTKEEITIIAVVVSLFQTAYNALIPMHLMRRLVGAESRVVAPLAPLLDRQPAQ
jgi:hypothetical protein